MFCQRGWDPVLLPISLISSEAAFEYSSQLANVRCLLFHQKIPPVFETTPSWPGSELREMETGSGLWVRNSSSTGSCWNAVEMLIWISFDLDWAESRQGWDFTDIISCYLRWSRKARALSIRPKFRDFRNGDKWYRNFYEKSSKKSENCGISEKKTSQPKNSEMEIVWRGNFRNLKIKKLSSFSEIR